MAAAAAADAAPRAPYFGPGGLAPRSPEIMVYFSHAVGGGAGGSMRPTFGLRVQQIRQAGNTGDPAEQGDAMQHRELLNWQMEGHSNMHLSESRVKFGNKLTYDFASSRFGNPSRSAMQIGTPTLRTSFANTAQPKPFAAPNPTIRSNPNRDNSNLRELASAVIAAMSPERFNSAQRPTTPRGITAIAAAQRMQTTNLR